MAAVATELIVTSPSFENGGKIPIQYTGRGEDISPQLTLSGISPDAKSIVIIMDDMNHPVPAYNHWLMWNVPVADFIPENIPYGAHSSGLSCAVQGCGYGKNRYRGPKPPFNWSHMYQYNVYTLDCMLNLPDSTKKRGLLAAMQGHVLQHGYLTGRFS